MICQTKICFSMCFYTNFIEEKQVFDLLLCLLWTSSMNPALKLFAFIMVELEMVFGVSFINVWAFSQKGIDKCISLRTNRLLNFKRTQSKWLKITEIFYFNLIYYFCVLTNLKFLILFLKFIWTLSISSIQIHWYNQN
jgi:hypothetical protein